MSGMTPAWTQRERPILRALRLVHPCICVPNQTREAWGNPQFRRNSPTRNQRGGNELRMAINQPVANEHLLWAKNAEHAETAPLVRGRGKRMRGPTVMKKQRSLVWCIRNHWVLVSHYNGTHINHTPVSPNPGRTNEYPRTNRANHPNNMIWYAQKRIRWIHWENCLRQPPHL